jgi:uncharacterized protein (TIGR00730 family)
MLKKSITVFCSANDLEKKYVDLAKDISQKICDQGYSLVYGASDKGTMKIVADVFENNGKEVAGITVDYLNNVARKDVTELIVADSLDDRKQQMLARGTFAVALPGGVGTLDELVYCIENIKHGLYKGKIFLINYENFFEGIRTQLKQMVENGFVDQKVLDKVIFVDNVDDFHRLMKNI